jgi:type I restriction enzyme R subunit
VDVAAETFTHKVERLKLQGATGADTARTVRAIAEDASRIPSDFVRDPQGEAARDLCLAPRRLQRASVDELNQIIETLAGLMKKRRKAPSALLEIDLPDEIELRGYILLQGMDQPVYAEEYRRRVEDWILDLAAGHPTVEAIARGEPVSDGQLLDLERTLRRRLNSGSDLHLTENNIRIAYKDRGLQVGSLIEFLRYLLDLDGIPDYAALVQRQFAQYVADHPFNADQIRFLRAVQNVFLQRRRLVLADLYEPPLSSFGADAVERWFTPDQVEDLLGFFNHLTVVGD